MNAKKAIVCGASVVAAFVLAALVGPRVYAQTSYPLMCRGGGTFELRVDTGFPAPTQAVLFVHFRGASAGAARRLPGPGECAWLDRGWRSGEPEVLRWTGPLQGVALSFTPDGRLTSVGVPSTGTSSADDADLRYLLNALRTGNTFQVQAQSVSLFGSRLLSITRVGP